MNQYKIQDINIDNIIIKKWITDFNDFKNNFFIKNKNGEYEINYRYKSIYNILLYIENKFWVDPIKYIYNQYYNEELSAVDLYDIYHKIASYKNKEKDNFIKIFKNIFIWELRDSNKPTDNTRKKLSKKKYLQMKPIALEKEKRIKKVENILKRIQKNKLNTTKINQKNIVLKTIAILNNIWINIGINDINTFSSKYWINVTAKAIKNILEENWYWNINFTSARISELLNKKKAGKTTE